MNVNLKCVYGNLHPADNPHTVDDNIGKMLVENDFAEPTGKKAAIVDTKFLKELKISEAKVAELESLVEELKAKVAELETKPKTRSSK